MRKVENAVYQHFVIVQNGFEGPFPEDRENSGLCGTGYSKRSS